MKKFTQWIVSKLIKDYQKVDDLKVRSKYGSLEGWVSIVVNVILFCVKIAIGLAINSVALIADAIHTLADCATSVVVIIGFKMSKKPSDKEHPFGHGRMESVATLVVSVLLFVAGFELLQKSVQSISNPQATTASVGVILLIIATIFIKELMARFSYILGDMIDSKALKADALHHRSDVLATTMVVAALIGSRLGFTRIDGIMGIHVSVIIFFSAYKIAKEAINPLLGEAVSKETLKEIGRIARSHAGILGVHDIIFHKYGQTSIISLHIEVSDKEDVNKLHALSEEVEDEISQKMGGMVVAHIDPVNKDHPKYEIISQAIKEIIDEDNRVNSFHELRIIGRSQDKCNIVFDIALEENADEQEIYDIIRSIRNKFKIRFPEMKTIIKAEPKYAYNF